MPPRLTTWRPRRTSRTTARKSIPNSNSTTPVHSPPPSSTAATATAAVPSTSTAVPTPPEPSQKTTSTHTSNATNTVQNPPNARTPASLTQSQNSQENLASNSGLVKSDTGRVDGNNFVEPGKSFDFENCSTEHCGQGKIIYLGPVTVVGSGEEVVNLSSLPVERPNAQGKSSVEPVMDTASVAAGVAGSGNGKRKIVRRTVRVVKRVIKKRVPKRVLMNGSGNQGVVVKAEDGVNLCEVRENLNLANDVIEKSNVVDEVVEKSSTVNEARNIVNVVGDLTENLNLVNDLNEKSDLVDSVMGKTSAIDEVMDKENITGGVMQNMKLVNTPNVSEPIIGKKGNDLSGIACKESEGSKLNFSASFSEQLLPANDSSGINITAPDNIKSNDVVSEVDQEDTTIHAPDLIEVEKVNNAPGTIMETKEIENTMPENQSKDSVVENEKIDIVSKMDVELLAGRNVELVGERSVVSGEGKSGRTIGKAESCSEVESGRIRSTEGLLLRGEMEALERKKRRKTEIFLGGLDKDTREDDIRKVFGEAGAIVEVRLVMSKTGKSRGFAFVRFATAADAKSALKKYSKVEVTFTQVVAA